MQYTYTELAAYLLLYSFIGWALEVAFFAVKERRFCNRGFFSLPLCPEYGIMMDILILLLPEQGTKWLLQFLTTWMVVSVVEYFSGGIAAKIWKKHLWNYEDVTLFGGKKKSVLLSLIKAAVVMTAVLLLHPPVFILFSMIPTIVLRIIDIAGFGLMAADLVSILIAVRKSRSLTELKETQGRLMPEQKEVKQKLGGKIYHAVWKRLNRAYPEMEALEEADRAERYVFARGVCVDKLIWVFMICAFLGDLIETLLKQDDSIIQDEDIKVFVDSLADSSVILGLRAWVKTEEYWSTRWRLLEEIKLIFDEEGIEIPFNQLTVHMAEK